MNNTFYHRIFFVISLIFQAPIITTKSCIVKTNPIKHVAKESEGQAAEYESQNTETVDEANKKTQNVAKTKERPSNRVKQIKTEMLERKKRAAEATPRFGQIREERRKKWEEFEKISKKRNLEYKEFSAKVDKLLQPAIERIELQRFKESIERQAILSTNKDVASKTIITKSQTSRFVPVHSQVAISQAQADRNDSLNVELFHSTLLSNEDRDRISLLLKIDEKLLLNKELTEEEADFLEAIKRDKDFLARGSLLGLAKCKELLQDLNELKPEVVELLA